jgi:hypothetical protein
LTNLELDSEHNKFSYQKLENQSFQFPIQVKKMTDEQNKEYHLKKLYPFSLKAIKIPKLETRLRQMWFFDMYFAGEQKKQTRLTNGDIVGKEVEINS